MTKNKNTKTPPQSAQDEWMELIKTAFWAVLLAVLIRTILFEPFNIPSSSMKPTLLVGDYLFVSKFTYGYSRYSLPFGLPLIEGRIMADEPKRGDIIVFKLPSDNKTDYIKRIIGMPGETIQVKDGRLYIDGTMTNRTKIAEENVTDRMGDTQTLIKYTQDLPGGFSHPIYEVSDNQALDNTPPFTVPEGHYFVMGDNRDNSQDSRVFALVGAVPFENIVGRADRLFFSTNGSAHLWEFWKWPWTIRYDRLLMEIK